MVADGEGYNGACVRQNLGRIDAFEGVSFEPGHFAVALAGEPILKMRGGLRRACGGDAAIVEPQLTRPRFDLFFHAGLVAWSRRPRRN